MAKNIGFRSWYYFRQGWSTYFAFIFAAINTLTVTYYLAIERAPYLKEIFPSFVQYIIIVTIIGIPLLALIGFLHYKKSGAYRSEADITFEVNPFVRRMLVNTEILIALNLALAEKTIKLSNNEKLTEKEIDEISRLKNEVSILIKERTFSNNKDLEFLKKEIENS